MSVTEKVASCSFKQSLGSWVDKGCRRPFPFAYHHLKRFARSASPRRTFSGKFESLQISSVSSLQDKKGLPENEVSESDFVKCWSDKVGFGQLVGSLTFCQLRFSKTLMSLFSFSHVFFRCFLSVFAIPICL
jgi:hypothetical protein